MVRTVSNLEDEENRDNASPFDGKSVDQKVNALRSKHSETEQRRRSKINERFQILRDLIPENDQKRDKASFLLEVIQYIQFLHEKLQMHEGSCQGWSPESTKPLPWRVNSGSVEGFVDQCHIDRSLSGHEDNNCIQPTLLSNVHNSVESDLVEAALYVSMDNTPMETKDLPLNIPFQASIFEGVPSQSDQVSFPNVDQLTHQSQSHLWPGRSCGDDCSVPIYSSNEEERKTESGESNISNASSQALLNSLMYSLQSSGVDLSQAVISVQLDIRKRTNGGSSSAVCDIEDHAKASGINHGTLTNSSPSNEYPHKRFKDGPF